MNRDPPTISIVTTSFNQGRFLAETIESVINQEGDFRLDYNIVDGGSSDNSVEIITRYATRLEQNLMTIRSLGIDLRWSSKPDNGAADAINTALKIATGNIFGFLNSDDLYEPGTLQHVLECFNGNKTIDILYGHALYVDEQNRIESMYPSADIENNNLLDGCWICQPSTFMRMDTYLSGGDFRTDLIAFDYEYWIRLQQLKKTFVFTDRILSRSRNHVNTKRHQNRRTIVLEALEFTRTDKGYNHAWRWHYVSELTVPGSIARILNKCSRLVVNALLILSYSYIWSAFQRIRIRHKKRQSRR